MTEGVLERPREELPGQVHGQVVGLVSIYL